MVNILKIRFCLYLWHNQLIYTVNKAKIIILLRIINKNVLLVNERVFITYILLRIIIYTYETLYIFLFGCISLYIHWSIGLTLHKKKILYFCCKSYQSKLYSSSFTSVFLFGRPGMVHLDEYYQNSVNVIKTPTKASISFVKRYVLLFIKSQSCGAMCTVTHTWCYMIGLVKRQGMSFDRGSKSLKVLQIISYNKINSYYC